MVPPPPQNHCVTLILWLPHWVSFEWQCLLHIQILNKHTSSDKLCYVHTTLGSHMAAGSHVAPTTHLHARLCTCDYLFTACRLFIARVSFQRRGGGDPVPYICILCCKSDWTDIIYKDNRRKFEEQNYHPVPKGSPVFHPFFLSLRQPFQEKNPKT